MASQSAYKAWNGYVLNWTSVARPTCQCLASLTSTQLCPQVPGECTNQGKGVWRVDFAVKGYGQYCLQLKIGSGPAVKNLHRCEGTSGRARDPLAVLLKVRPRLVVLCHSCGHPRHHTRDEGP